jgi:phenylpyruvate tautomerase PptA (4-oxalocrotonate tautomerase family)
MPHLTLHALEDDLTDREAALVAALTASVVDVYGDWARDLVSVQLTGLRRGRWALGGQLVQTVSPTVTLGIREAAFARADADELVAQLVASITAAVVELVGTPAGRTGVGGVVS